MPIFGRVFTINECWILSKYFSVSIEIIIWFLFSNLLICCIILTDLCVLKNPCIPGINLTWSWCACMHAQLLQSCPTFCDCMDYSLPGSSVHRILQARILEWVAMPSSGGSSYPRDQTCVSFSYCTAGGFFTAEPPGRPWSWCMVFLMCSWILFHRILLKIFASMFISHIGP